RRVLFRSRDGPFASLRLLGVHRSNVAMHLGLSALIARARGPLSPSTRYRCVPYPQFSSADRMAVQGEGMSQMGGSGRRRVMAVAAVVLALCVVAPELAAPIGAATPTTTGTAVSQPNGHVVLV